MKRKKKSPWPNYKVVELPKELITFGTTLFIRDDKHALRIVFPAGQVITFCPETEIPEGQNALEK